MMLLLLPVLLLLPFLCRYGSNCRSSACSDVLTTITDADILEYVTTCHKEVSVAVSRCRGVAVSRCCGVEPHGLPTLNPVALCAPPHASRLHTGRACYYEYAHTTKRTRKNPFKKKSL